MRRIIRVIGPIARATLLEAARSRMLWLVAILCLLCLGLAGFVGQVAIIEAPQMQAAILAAILRAAAAFLTAAFVTMSIVREYDDKVFELMLAQPWPRGAETALRRGHPREALSRSLRGLSFSPHEPLLCYLAASACFELGAVEGAMRLLTHTLWLHPGHHAARADLEALTAYFDQREDEDRAA